MADGTTLSAATFVCAVLEQAGYLAQAEILNDFKAFFREAGAFLYLLSIAAGIVSVVTFGSFRAARYLIIGPAFFWFLIGPTAEFDGVLWQIGDAPARAINPRNRGDQVSKDSVKKVLEQIGFGNKSQNTGSAGTTGGTAANVDKIKVAYFFSFFVRVINNLTKELSQEILGDESKYLNYISKGKALDFLINHDPTDPYLNETFQNNLMQGCQKFFGMAMALSAYDLTKDSYTVAPDTKDQADKRRKEYLELFNNYKGPDTANTQWIKLSDGQTRSLKMMYYMKIGGVTAANIDYIRTAFVEDSLVSSELAKLMPEKSITCQEAWVTIAKFLSEDYAPQRTDYIIDIASGDGKNREEACLDIEEKVTGKRSSDSAGCKERLNRIVSLFILKNGLTRGLPFARAAQYEANKSPVSNSFKEPGYVNLETGKAAGQVALSTFHPGPPTARAGLSAAHDIFGGDNSNTQMSGYVSAVQDQAINKSRWAPAARLIHTGGNSDAAFVELPKYQIRNLRQTLFAWALNVPYWQGVLLYLIAICYPFAALMVLIPSKAQSFLTIPMAWLWVKSWDIGFVCTMVLEKVLWNIFPSTKIGENLINNNLEKAELYDALSEIQKYDHTWNLHMYYMMLSLVTLSIPTVMGYLTLRSKRAILSSFTDKLMSDTKQSGENLAAGYKLNLASERQKVMKDAKGAAAMYTGSREKGGLLHGEGLVGGTRDKKIGFFNKMQFISDVTGIKSVGFDGAVDLAIGQLDSTRKGLNQQIAYDRQQNISDHPVLGRWGLIQMLNDAYSVQYDQSGGFELTDIDLNSADEFIKSFVAKTNRMYEYGSDIAANLAVKATNIPGDQGISSVMLKAFAGFEAFDVASGNTENLDKALEYIQRQKGFENFTKENLLSEMEVAFDAPFKNSKDKKGSLILDYSRKISSQRKEELYKRFDPKFAGSPAADLENSNINPSILEAMEPLPQDGREDESRERSFNIKKPVKNYYRFN